MAVWFVSGHDGAAEWFRQRGLVVDHEVKHLNPADVHSGDRVIGTLPVHIAAEICSLGGHYFHLAMEIPAEDRHRELTVNDMENFGARIEEFVVTKVAPA